MRDIKRIPIVLKAIEKNWLKHPDYRFGQWFCNEIIDSVGDPFFIEDDDLLKLINKKNELSQKTSGRKTL